MAAGATASSAKTAPVRAQSPSLLALVASASAIFCLNDLVALAALMQRIELDDACPRSFPPSDSTISALSHGRRSG